VTDGAPGSGPTTAESPTVAVTGAGGYIGSRVVGLLRERHPDWAVVALDNSYKSQVNEVGDVEVEDVDVRDREALEAALAGADVVVHLAALSGVDDCEEHPDLAYEVNVQGTENVAWHCRKTGAAMSFPFSMAVLGDPTEFPVRVDLPRDPMNWYARTKYVGERAVEAFAEGAFPAHFLMKSNAYGEHVVGDTVVSKVTVINFFVDRALSGEPITVYSPGTQARNYLHVVDAARAHVRSVERLTERLEAGETGSWKYEIGSEEDYSVMTVAERVRAVVSELTGEAPEIQLVENPREESLVEQFAVDTSRAREELGWAPTHSVDEAIRAIVERELERRTTP
jgi:UDP-glucose 4-epimerase